MGEMNKEQVLEFVNNLTDDILNDKDKMFEFATASVKPRHPNETKEFYSEKWAKNYDKGVITMGYNGPQSAVNAFIELNLPKDSRILDIGCGTGQIGVLLQKNGYNNIDGLDISTNMLEVSKQKKCYKHLFESIVTKDDRLPIDDKTYDAIIMTGVLCPGHIRWNSFPQMIRVVKSGGIILWVVQNTNSFEDIDEDFKNGNNERIVESLCEQKVWKHLSGFPKNVENYLIGNEGIAYAMKVI